MHFHHPVVPSGPVYYLFCAIAFVAEGLNKLSGGKA